MSETLTPAQVEHPTPERPWVRPLVVVAAVLSLLLLGAAGGMALGRPGGGAVPDAGSVDVGFAQDMAVHHQQAVQMAGRERDAGADLVLRALAQDMELTQQHQIGQMQGWLALWNAPSLPTGPHMAWMAGADPAAHSGHGDTAPGPAGNDRMPGMATAEELAELRTLSGPALDVRFLQLMLRHHEGGAPMLRYAAERAETPQVRNLAAQMLTSQTAESEYLRALLAERGGEPLPVG